MNHCFFLVLSFVFGSVDLNAQQNGSQWVTSENIENLEKVRAWVLEFKHPPSDHEEKEIERRFNVQLSPFHGGKSDYFGRLRVVEQGVSKESFEESIGNLTSKEKIKFGILSFERVFNAKSFQVLSVPGDLGVTKDPFSNLQWALRNKGQILMKEMDDITSVQVRGVPEFDLNFVPSLSLSRAKVPVVAIVDSGLDLNHPDLVGKIKVNLRECEGGLPPLVPKEDRDGNGYKGDCKGWNFTVDPTTSAANKVSDETGHGTHLAGIVGAVSDNSIGISGISRALILPLQVVRSSKGNNDLGSRTDWIAKAILYAADQGVDVINLSLGWPQFMDTRFVREAVQTAIDRGVIVVAAAGNNNSSEMIFPCAYRGVICVGSVRNDGKVSTFSNFGGHVDVLAPGDNILSLYPLNREPMFFPYKGYEYKSGTSQATAFVSGLVAEMRSVLPQLDRLGALNRLIDTAISPKEDVGKTTLGGVVRYFESLTQVQGTGRIVPILKESFLVPVDLTSGSFRWSLPIQNLSDGIESIRVEVLPEVGRVNLEKKIFTLSLKPQQLEMISIKGNLLGQDKADFELGIKISQNGRVAQYTHKLRFARELISDLQVRRRPIQTGEDDFSLWSVPRYESGAKDPIFYSYEKEGTGLRVQVFEVQELGVVKRGEVLIPGGLSILSIHQLDFNSDRLLDLQIQVLLEIEGKRSIRFLYLKKSMSPLFEKFQTWNFLIDSVLLPQRNVSWIPVDHERLGRIKVPIFLARGALPKSEQKLIPFENLDSGARTRVYYFWPQVENETVTWIPRTIDSITKKRSWAKRFQAERPETFSPLVIDKQGRVLFSVGVGYSRRALLAEIHFHPGSGEATEKFSRVETGGLTLDGYLFDQGKIIGAENEQGMFLLAQHDKLRWDLLWWQNYTVENLFRIEPGVRDETLEIYIQSFLERQLLTGNEMESGRLSTGDAVVSFVQTPSEILATKWSPNLEPKRLRHPFHVSTFFPNSVFLGQTQPVFAAVSGEANPKPALYVDATQVLSRSVFVMVPNDTGLDVSIRNNVLIPPFCTSLNPMEVETNKFAITLLCKTDLAKKGEYVLKELAGWELWTLDF